MSNPLVPVVTPDLKTLLDLYNRDIQSTLWCHMLGTIQGFDAAKQSASVSLNFLRLFKGESKPYPLLTDVPVYVQGGGGRCITTPIKPGDTCLVLFNDRDFDNWWETGISTVPNSIRLHDISDGLALVGFRSKANPVPDYSETDVEIRNESSKIGVGDKILIKNQTTDMRAVMDLLVTALSTLNSLKTGGSAATQITAFQTAAQQLYKS